MGEQSTIQQPEPKSCLLSVSTTTGHVTNHHLICKATAFAIAAEATSAVMDSSLSTKLREAPEETLNRLSSTLAIVCSIVAGTLLTVYLSPPETVRVGTSTKEWIGCVRVCSWAPLITRLRRRCRFPSAPGRRPSSPAHPPPCSAPRRARALQVLRPVPEGQLRQVCAGAGGL